MSDDNSDAVVSAVATMAAVRAVVNYLEDRDPGARAAIQRQLRIDIPILTGEAEPGFAERVMSRANLLLFTP